jgi:hypothetical protein
MLYFCSMETRIGILRLIRSLLFVVINNGLVYKTLSFRLLQNAENQQSLLFYCKSLVISVVNRCYFTSKNRKYLDSPETSAA